MRDLLSPLRSLRQVVLFATVANDVGSVLSLWRAARPGAPDGLRSVRLRALSGAEVCVRQGTADPTVVNTTFAGRYHIPPRGVVDPRLIWDLGANIGLTMVHMAHLYPRARVVGVEMDPGNAAVARRNVRSLGDRCEVVEAAVWPTDGEVRYRREPGHEDAFAVTDGGERSTMALSLNSLLARTGPPDYVKMDIEGAERAVLAERTEWAREVRCIAVECHAPYSLERCLHDLELLGFDAYPLARSLRRRAQDCAVGVRNRSKVAHPR